MILSTKTFALLVTFRSKVEGGGGALHMENDRSLYELAITET